MFSENEVKAISGLNLVHQSMCAQFVQRDSEITGLSIALIAGTNMLLLGPPGTAKSLVTEVFAKSLNVADNEYYERQLGAFTVPEEVFGPFDLPKLEAGIYERKVDGYLPTAKVAYLDEIFNANQSLLTTLNKVLNEHKFDQGTQRLDCPLDLCVGAANVYPEGDLALEALYDRFLIRFWTPYINTRQGMIDLLTSVEPEVTATLESGDIELLRAARKKVQVPKNVLEVLLDIRDELAGVGIECSDRRWKQVLKLVQAKAVLEAREVAAVRDLMVLADSVWDKHEDRPQVYGIVAAVCAPELHEATMLLDAAIQCRAEVDLKDPSAKAERRKAITQIGMIVKELNDLGGTSKDAEIAEMMMKVSRMKADIARAVAKLDLRVGVGLAG